VALATALPRNEFQPRRSDAVTAYWVGAWIGSAGIRGYHERVTLRPRGELPPAGLLSLTRRNHRRQGVEFYLRIDGTHQQDVLETFRLWADEILLALAQVGRRDCPGGQHPIWLIGQKGIPAGSAPPDSVRGGAGRQDRQDFALAPARAIGERLRVGEMADRALPSTSGEPERGASPSLCGDPR
jgi:hypothetical protein